ncbi:hypothetical protein [Methylotenera sp. N17]|uniref:hypothetical protein n=1 Tax=Methylotenera sp. N17 TaxID=1502761 RepID=UPI00068ABAF3|nr:hypothetical protein [Methylotenera sp. N17]
MSYIFPLANMANAFAMTVLLIALGLTGHSTLVAEVGIVQGATLALFYAFSANARSLILNKSAAVSANSVMAFRLLTLTPLAVISYWLSVSATAVSPILAILLITRRVAEWLSEVHLSEMERLDNRLFATQYFVVQSLLLVLAFGLLVMDSQISYLGLSVWALFPLLFSFKFICSGFANFPSLTKNMLFKMLPHLGSTAIIGIGVYVFRLLILLLIGKEIAGDLYTAFAIGGLTGSVFANSLGASIALHEQRSGKRHFPKMVRLPLNLSLLAGALIFVAATIQLDTLAWLGKTYFFWQATGLSLIGGVVMVYAQRVRFRLIQHDEYHDVFGPDVMMNILLITSIPFIYYLLGLQALAGLYLLSSLLALVFYKSYQLAEIRSSKGQFNLKIGYSIIAVMILFPLYLQLSNGIFRSASLNFNSGADLHFLPIPVSVIACYVGILMIAAYRYATTSLYYIFFTCLLMVTTTVAISQGVNAEQQSKFILLIQFILPMFGLVLGQMYYAKNQSIVYSLEKSFLYVLLFIVPLQLTSTWLQGYTSLSPYLYVFSIYQHVQYVPVIFVSAFLVAFCGLWSISKFKNIFLAFTPLMGIYTAASMSLLAIVMLIAGLLGFALYQWRRFFDKTVIALVLLVTILMGGYLEYKSDFMESKLTFFNVINQDEIASNMIGRQYFAKNIVTDPETFLLGHAERPSRAQFPSAHNYYLDIIYSFGFLALLPTLVMLIYTLVLLYRFRNGVLASTDLLCLSAIVLFLVVVDNSFKVGLRQPYSGIFTFFIWGILISKLHLNFLKVSK